MPDSTLSELWRFTELKQPDACVGAVPSEFAPSHEFLQAPEVEKALKNCAAPAATLAASWRQIIAKRVEHVKRATHVPLRLMPAGKAKALLAWALRGGGLCLELFAGKEGLSKACVDTKLFFLAGVDVVQCDSEDLTDVAFIELLLLVTKSGAIRFLHAGIECRT